MGKKVSIVLVLIGFIVIGWLYVSLGVKAVDLKEAKTLRVRKNWTSDSITLVLTKDFGLKNPEKFAFWLKNLRYTKTFPCRITINPNDGFWKIITNLKNNRFQANKISINPEWELTKLCKIVSQKMEIDSIELSTALQSDSYMSTFGLNSKNWQSLFIPNTYEIFAKTELKEFLQKMQKESIKFWNTERIQKAENQGFNQQQVFTIASIVTKESHKTDEYNNIAGVYINRLRIGMRLQADPTVAFARGYAGIILYKDLKIDNEYNTYFVDGLPPGPICIPNLKSIDAVLNYDNHTYLFFCAKEDFSGYHSFASNGVEHEKNANRWRAAIAKAKKNE